MTGLWKDSVHQAGLSNNRAARIAIGHLQLLRSVGMGICEYMVLGSVFVFKSCIAYIVGVKGRTLVLETVYHCSSSLWHLPIVADCKISEKQGRKNT